MAKKLNKIHKWGGIIFTFFIFMFVFSGVILNHRDVFSKFSVNRNLLPKAYHYSNWNNGFVKGSFKINKDSILLFGGGGIYLTNENTTDFTDFNNGLEKGIDNRKISNIIRLNDNEIWAAGLYSVYKLDRGNNIWLKQNIDMDKERVADINYNSDTLFILTRSHIYQSLSPYDNFEKIELAKPDNYTGKVSLFKQVWMLHSGELFGLTGKIVVDILGIVIVILCVTGLSYTLLPKIIKRRKSQRKSVLRYVSLFKKNLNWHNKLGSWLIILTVLLAFTGMCLRPPLMIPLAMNKTKVIPGTSLDSENPWNDRLRSIRYDKTQKLWLISSSEGFYKTTHFKSNDITHYSKAPSISPMGINVFQPKDSSTWIIGSFSGLNLWNPSQGKIVDYFTGEPIKKTFGRPIGRNVIAGYSSDFKEELIFDYAQGAISITQKPNFVAMPSTLKKTPMSLWNFALELHVGRCYQPLLGPLSDLFVFISGIFLCTILISGYIIYRRGHKKKARK